MTNLNTATSTKFSSTVDADTRYGFTQQFLIASVLFVKEAVQIEERYSTDIGEDRRARHRGLICAALMQSVAALETEAYEISYYGPGSYLGSGGMDQEAKELLNPKANEIDNLSILDRFERIFSILGKPSIDKSREPYQSMILVIRLRNELTHYKSKWGDEMESAKLFAALESLNHEKPIFIDESQNFFPHRCLSAATAKWAVNSTITFLECTYEKLGVESRFRNYTERLVL